MAEKAAPILGLQCCALDVMAEERFALRGETLQQALAEEADHIFFS
jgi:hypothetical protein